MTIVFMNVAVADDPAHSDEQEAEADAGRAGPEPRMSSSVGRDQVVDDVGGQHLGRRASSSRSSISRTEASPMTAPR